MLAGCFPCESSQKYLVETKIFSNVGLALSVWAGRQSGRGLGSFRQLRVSAVRSETCGGEPRKTREGGTTQQIQSTVRPFRKGESNLDKLRFLSRRVRARAENTEIKGENSELLT